MEDTGQSLPMTMEGTMIRLLDQFWIVRNEITVPAIPHCLLRNRRSSPNRPLQSIPEDMYHLDGLVESMLDPFRLSLLCQGLVSQPKPVTAFIVEGELQVAPLEGSAPLNVVLVVVRVPC
jgi:hypothetical protein